VVVEGLFRHFREKRYKHRALAAGGEIKECGWFRSIDSTEEDEGERA